MPASRSPKPIARPARRSYGWLVAAALLAAVIFIVSALPASIALRFLPKDIRADDASGTLWHGSFAQVTVRGRQIGALEWRLHPLPLFTGALNADVRWIKQGFVLDAVLAARGNEVSAQEINGGGAIEDLAELGITRGWTGTVHVAIPELRVDAQKIRAAAGTIKIEALKSKRFGDADVGGYELSFTPESVQPDGSALAQVRDLGGPLQLTGALTIAPAQSLATFSGAVKERTPLPPQLQQEFENLVQMRGRDAQGRVPLEIEFAL